MLLKLFLLSFILVALASMGLSFAMLWNKQTDIAEEIEPGSTESSACGACSIKSISTCSQN